MSHPSNNGHDNGNGPVYALRIYRIEPGANVHVRILGEHYGGISTHFVRGRSHYCPGADCNPLHHKNEPIWKGYVAAQLYLPDRKKWAPIVLEITESLELDFREVMKRGQTWELWRQIDPKKKSMPVTGKLWEEHDPAKLPPAFDIRPVLMHVYHVQRIDLSVKNPLPPRVIVQDCDGPPPMAMSNVAPMVEPLTPEEIERRSQEYAKRKKAPSQQRIKTS